MNYWKIILSIILIAGTVAGQERKEQKKPQVLKPVPMNLGPLGPAGYLVLVPLDDRPATGRYAGMIGAVADHRVTMPPRDLLGRYTKPGDADKIIDWLKSQQYSKVDALIVSADMLAYGGLVASRVNDIPFEAAKKRLEFFRWFKNKYPSVPVYAFSVIMRLAPTATARNRDTHHKLARWAELKGTGSNDTQSNPESELNKLSAELGPKVIEDYPSTRRRNLQVNLAMVELAAQGIVNELVFLQDDARQSGLHRQDQAVIKSRLRELGLETRVPIYNGADEGASTFVSRAVLDKFSRKLKVGVVYSSEKSRQIVAPFEDQPLEYTVENHIRASGGVPVSEFEQSDYRLFINAPGSSDEEFDIFLKKLVRELNGEHFVALADLLFPEPHRSGADERIIQALKQENIFTKFAGYAAWNTAGNTLGTAIPHANMRVFFRTKLNDRADRAARTEASHFEFLLNRFANDYIYHDVVRPEVNEKLKRETGGNTVPPELTDLQFQQINAQVESMLRDRVESFFNTYFKGIRRTLAVYSGVEKRITVNGVKDLDIFLPWPRTFEVDIAFKIDYSVN